MPDLCSRMLPVSLNPSLFDGSRTKSAVVIALASCAQGNVPRVSASAALG